MWYGVAFAAFWLNASLEKGFGAVSATLQSLIQLTGDTVFVIGSVGY
jgi:hypothetical protein